MHAFWTFCLLWQTRARKRIGRPNRNAHQLTRVTTRLYPCSRLPTPLLLFQNNPHSSITYTHNQYRLSAVIDPGTVYTQLLSPDRGLLPGIKDPEKDTWSHTHLVLLSHLQDVSSTGRSREYGHLRLWLYTGTISQCLWHLSVTI